MPTKTKKTSFFLAAGGGWQLLATNFPLQGFHFVPCECQGYGDKVPKTLNVNLKRYYHVLLCLWQCSGILVFRLVIMVHQRNKLVTYFYFYAVMQQWGQKINTCVLFKYGWTVSNASEWLKHSSCTAQLYIHWHVLETVKYSWWSSHEEVKHPWKSEMKRKQHSTSFWKHHTLVF